MRLSSSVSASGTNAAGRVKVPVLSKTTCVTSANRSNAVACRTRNPAENNLLIAAVDTAGTARPRAQGHAIIRTAIALINAYAILGSGPNVPHAIKVRTLTTITAGTNIPLKSPLQRPPSGSRTKTNRFWPNFRSNFSQNNSCQNIIGYHPYSRKTRRDDCCEEMALLEQKRPRNRKVVPSPLMDQKPKGVPGAQCFLPALRGP